MSDHHHHGEERHMGHVQSLGIYMGVFFALLALTIATFMVAKLDLGHLGNELAAVGIAGVKASLVTAFFMHGKYENKVTLAFVLYPAVLLLILIGGLFMDYTNRELQGGKTASLFKITEPVTHYSAEHEGGEAAAGEHQATEEHAAPAEAHTEPAAEPTDAAAAPEAGAEAGSEQAPEPAPADAAQH